MAVLETDFHQYEFGFSPAAYQFIQLTSIVVFDYQISDQDSHD